VSVALAPSLLVKHDFKRCDPPHHSLLASTPSYPRPDIHHTTFNADITALLMRCPLHVWFCTTRRL